MLEALEGLADRHGAAGVPFKDLEAATRSRLNYRALTDALNALVNEGAVHRVTEKPARLAITDLGRRRLDEYIPVRMLLTGAGGQLAQDLARAAAGWEVVALTHRQLDITDTARIEAVLTDVAPDVLVNTAAFHQVDRCESEPEASFLVNAAAPQRLAAAWQGRTR